MRSKDKIYLVARKENNKPFKGTFDIVNGKYHLVNSNDSNDILTWYDTVNNNESNANFKVGDYITGIEITNKNDVKYVSCDLEIVKRPQLDMFEASSKEFNVCSELDVREEKIVDINYIFELQKKTQENTYNYKFDDMSIKQISEFWFMNSHALQDEIHEMFDALGGMHDGVGNAAWKPWKKKNSVGKYTTIEDLSGRDLKELKFEIVDAFHFMINFAVSVGMTGSEMIDMYISKNKENINRQKNNY